MSTLLLTLGLALVGGVLGGMTGRALATGGYRIEDDIITGPPGRPWWPAPALALIWGSLTWTLGPLAAGAVLPAYLLFGWLTIALIWIDLDVHRLPNGLVLPAYPAIAALLLLPTLATGGNGWRTGLIGAGLVGALFLLLSLLPGGMGWGDVKLAPIMGALLGWFGLSHVFYGVIAAFIIGGVMALSVLLRRTGDRHTHVAFGPAMCLGTLLTVLVAPTTAITVG